MSRSVVRRHQTTGLICCNFVFTHGAWIREVPEDPAMINAGHEAALSARTFTHGYDLYLPDEIQVWHLDYDNYPDGERHKVWEAKSSRWQTERTEEMIRRNRIIFYGQGDPRTLGRYGLGEVRSVAAWGGRGARSRRAGGVSPRYQRRRGPPWWVHPRRPDVPHTAIPPRGIRNCGAG